jgi:predicted phage replisome organizer
MAKKYYWLKLRNDWFGDKRIKKLRSTAGGDTYTIIYLKMQLLSLKNEGKLFFEGVEDDFVSELALDLDEEVENVKITVSFLMKNGMLELNNTDEYLLTEVPETIGSETAGAERVRKFRNNKKALQCNTNVTECNTEIDKEIESELDKESNGETEIFTVSKDTVSRTDVQRAVEEWNSLAVYGLKPVSKLTSGTKRAKCLNARIKEYGIDEVLAAIERIKNSDFLKGNNKSGWMITFDWFVLPNNFPKVHDGYYENSTPRPQNGGSQSHVEQFADFARGWAGDE